MRYKTVWNKMSKDKTKEDRCSDNSRKKNN